MVGRQTSLVEVFSLDGGFVYLHGVVTDNETTELYDKRGGIRCLVDRRQRKVKISVSQIQPHNLYFLMRIVRELASADSLIGSGASIPVHGSAFTLEGRGVLVSGPKRTGKTTALLSALHHKGSQHVGN